MLYSWCPWLQISIIVPQVRRFIQFLLWVQYSLSYQNPSWLSIFFPSDQQELLTFGHLWLKYQTPLLHSAEVYVC